MKIRAKKQALPCAPAPPFLYGKMDVSQAKIVAQTHIARESQRERERKLRQQNKDPHCGSEQNAIFYSFGR
jgi:hypothetical protein